MSEIEKMYENAGLLYCSKCRHDSEIDCIYMCENKYPPFTAEKQLELFKLLMRHPKTEMYCRYANDKYKLIMYTEECCTDNMDSFENDLASIVCNLWGLLSEEERKQIKEILED